MNIIINHDKKKNKQRKEPRQKEHHHDDTLELGKTSMTQRYAKRMLYTSLRGSQLRAHKPI